MQIIIPRMAIYINVDKVLQRFSNRVIISGAVFRPGIYELTQGMTVDDLIKKADGLTEDAYKGRAQIFRLNDDLSKGILSFNAFEYFNNNFKKRRFGCCKINF